MDVKTSSAVFQIKARRKAAVGQLQPVLCSTGKVRGNVARDFTKHVGKVSETVASDRVQLLV